MTVPTIKPGVLTLACSGMAAPPLFYTDNDGARHGYEPDVAAATARALGLEIEWLFLQWADFEPALMERRADGIWCGSAITPEREKRFLYSRPYAIFDEAVLVRSGEGIASPDDLAGKRIGAISGSTNMALAEGWVDVGRVDFDGATDDVLGDMVAALRAGDIDGVVDDDCAFGALIDEPAFEIAFTVKTGNRWGVAMHPDSEDLKRSIDRGLDHVILSHGLQAIWKRWFPALDLPQLS
ncbi:MAG: ABC transporter substrate-binding protein [Rhodospirillales bacterium]